MWGRPHEWHTSQRTIVAFFNFFISCDVCCCFYCSADNIVICNTDRSHIYGRGTHENHARSIPCMVIYLLNADNAMHEGVGEARGTEAEQCKCVFRLGNEKRRNNKISVRIHIFMMKIYRMCMR